MPICYLVYLRIYVHVHDNLSGRYFTYATAALQTQNAFADARPGHAHDMHGALVHRPAEAALHCCKSWPSNSSYPGFRTKGCPWPNAFPCYPAGNCSDEQFPRTTTAIQTCSVAATGPAKPKHVRTSAIDGIWRCHSTLRPCKLVLSPARRFDKNKNYKPKLLIADYLVCRPQKPMICKCSVVNVELWPLIKA